ncbi:MAG: hypothetical protein A2504_09075 [Bdellovibrionales bacterium RIFOXYD12_FULL_39_22]|nr:MAG: hypothetical protein A2385_17475 [Bdellovibrionales bacterium RIFOXYB1_FULL_39_21]OFZ41107.1 MAG: hypothetical protein A2485_00400 [Bdellovibrionales bacterium RIFOXYC12_FULL_39_17]OFZ50320.1 MAG: hypothetical protein A2404_07715 [Bdellovibrionales bacterium RIFOXYC1_FULL_39_130]OFZ75121.1 MAG: hypothetical protein A2560_16410 [Bdellovibrionales bacterium RIFOXYD1_FULL_39_84]OFZ92237.1 MAG: hypothetical protein A2504_09075 [Bdellovibrionales bacterium RIFOXYD12_FULL_39_22]HLE10960.1 hy
MKISLLFNTLFICTASLIYLSSCSSTIGLGISDSKYDALSNESLLRYNDDRKKVIYKNTDSSFHNVLLCHDKKFTEGIEGLKNKFPIGKKDPEYWNQLGTCYYLKEDYLKAQFFYNLSLDAAKKQGISYPPAYNNLGIISIKQGHLQEGLELLKTASEMSPSLLTVTFNLSQIYLQFHLYDKAITLLEKLYNRSSSDIDVLASLGTGYLHKGDSKKAIFFFEKINTPYQKRIDISTTFALALYVEKDFKRAKDILSAHDRTPFVEYEEPALQLAKLIDMRLEEIRKKEEEEKRKAREAQQNSSNAANSAKAK